MSGNLQPGAQVLIGVDKFLDGGPLLPLRALGEAVLVVLALVAEHLLEGVAVGEEQELVEALVLLQRLHQQLLPLLLRLPLPLQLLPAHTHLLLQHPNRARLRLHPLPQLAHRSQLLLAAVGRRRVARDGRLREGQLVSDVLHEVAVASEFPAQVADGVLEVGLARLHRPAVDGLEPGDLLVALPQLLLLPRRQALQRGPLALLALAALPARARCLADGGHMRCQLQQHGVVLGLLAPQLLRQVLLLGEHVQVLLMGPLEPCLPLAGLTPRPLVPGLGLPQPLRHHLHLETKFLFGALELGGIAVRLEEEERLVLGQLLEEGELVGLGGKGVLEAEEGGGGREGVEALRDEADGVVVGHRLQFLHALLQVLQLLLLGGVLGPQRLPLPVQVVQLALQLLELLETHPEANQIQSKSTPAYKTHTHTHNHSTTSLQTQHTTTSNTPTHIINKTEPMAEVLTNPKDNDLAKEEPVGLVTSEPQPDQADAHGHKKRRRRPHRKQKTVRDPEEVKSIRLERLNLKREVHWDSHFINDTIPELFKPKRKRNEHTRSRPLQSAYVEKERPKLPELKERHETAPKSNHRAFKIRHLRKEEAPREGATAAKEEPRHDVIPEEPEKHRKVSRRERNKDKLLLKLEEKTKLYPIQQEYRALLTDLINRATGKRHKPLRTTLDQEIDTIGSNDNAYVRLDKLADERAAMLRAIKTAGPAVTLKSCLDLQMQSLALIEELLKFKARWEAIYHDTLGTPTRVSYCNANGNYLLQMAKEAAEVAENDPFLVQRTAALRVAGSEEEAREWREMTLKIRACELLLIEEELQA